VSFSNEAAKAPETMKATTNRLARTRGRLVREHAAPENATIMLLRRKAPSLDATRNLDRP